MHYSASAIPVAILGIGPGHSNGMPPGLRRVTRMATGASAQSEQHRLPRSIEALEDGDYRTALNLCNKGMAAEDPRIAMLAVLLRTTAGGIHALACGEVASAIRQFSTAAAMLPPALKHLDRYGRPVATLVAEPLSESFPIAAWTCRSARILWREQHLIAHLLWRLSEPASARDHMIEACMQFLREVEFMPFSWHRPTRGITLDDPPVTATRGDICRRASNLRKLSQPRKGDVSQSVWHDIGGYRGLRTEALFTLANRPLTPWPKSVDVPIRFGHQDAWDYATHWKNRLSAGKSQ
jgi:hypothetical protein